MANQSAFEQWLTWALSPSISAILVTLVIALLTPILTHYFFYQKSGSKELPSFLLIGPSGSGKTSIFVLFADGKELNTHTSQEPQSVVCKLPSSTRSSDDKYRSENDTSGGDRPSFLLLDTPGHGKLRHHALSSLTSASALRGLIFVVDSAAGSSATGLTEAAEYLHDVLLVLQKRHSKDSASKEAQTLPILVAANKQDVFTSLPAPLVKKRLEEEVGRVRQTKSKALLDSGIGMEDEASGDEEGNWLGEFGSKQFAFAQMEEHGVDVKIAGGNVRGEGDADGVVKEWWDWIGENL